MKKFIVLIVFLIIITSAFGNTPNPIRFGNAIYVNLSSGQIYKHHNIEIEVIELEGNFTHIRVDKDSAWFDVSRRSLPKEVGGLRLFVADQLNVKKLTTDTNVHNLLSKEVLLCISDVSAPLLDHSQFLFPISKEDNFKWTLEEDSHMFAYLHTNKWNPGIYRSHEGIDFNLHDARDTNIHPVVAIESGTIIVVADSSITKSKDGCIILKSASQENIYYVYKHTKPETHLVKVGQKVKKGQKLAYILGDNKWGHLHFAITYRTDVPSYEDRYTNTLNYFPQMYELYFGNLKELQKVRSEGQFQFGYPRWTCKNSKKIDSFDAIRGFGWNLGSWNPAQKVESTHDNYAIGNARLNKTLYQGCVAECKNPKNYYDFEVAVENGTYNVKAIVGDLLLPTRQTIYFENSKVGTFNIEAGNFTETKENKVKVEDNKLTIRLELSGENYAGIKELYFKKAGD